MKFWDKFGKQRESGIQYDGFEKWLNLFFLKDQSEEIVAFAFNLYEEANSIWSVELVGTSSFDPEDQDWVCDEVSNFGSRDNPFTWSEDGSWEVMLKEVCSIVEKYLQNGRFAAILKSGKAVGVGFVDGDLEIVFES